MGVARSQDGDTQDYGAQNEGRSQSRPHRRKGKIWLPPREGRTQLLSLPLQVPMVSSQTPHLLLTLLHHPSLWAKFVPT